jgi:hypothetical protein
VAANTPQQFRKLTAVLGMEALCEDARALDLEAFNAPGRGFVVPRDADYVIARCARPSPATRPRTWRRA